MQYARIGENELVFQLVNVSVYNNLQNIFEIYYVSQKILIGSKI